LFRGRQLSQDGGGSGLSGLHGQAAVVVVVVTTGGGGAAVGGSVVSGGAGGFVVARSAVVVVSVDVATILSLDALFGVDDGVDDFDGFPLTQVEAGVLSFCWVL
jgi:hypothetical protein